MYDGIKRRLLLFMTQDVRYSGHTFNDWSGSSSKSRDTQFIGFLSNVTAAPRLSLIHFLKISQLHTAIKYSNLSTLFYMFQVYFTNIT